MERVHRPSSVEPHRGILVQRRRFSLRLYRVVSGITAKESRPASLELTFRRDHEPNSALAKELPNVRFGSKADMKHARPVSALPLKADVD